METLKIKKSVLQKITNAGLKTPDKEVCGLILGQRDEDTWFGFEFYQVDNITKKPAEIDYEMNPQQVMDILKTTKKFNKDSDKELVSVWHTHPHNQGIPSSIDINNVAYKIPYIIFGLLDGRIKAWNIDKKNKKYTQIKVEMI